MRRLPHGGTTRPGPARPGGGYGRSPGRPGPSHGARVAASAHRQRWAATADVVDAVVTAGPPLASVADRA